MDWEALELSYAHQCSDSQCEVHLKANEDVPDWADILAKLWADQIREMYRNKGFDGTPSSPIVIETAKHLMKPINDVFGQAIDYDSPDYVLRETLKENVWDFSVAKNYQDNVRLNNLLLDDSGKLRSWSDFKHEAQKVVGTSNRYLQTEYNTVVAGAQMSRLWQEIQRDKHLFPFAQFDVVDDKKTSDICWPLRKVIVSVDDPMLAYYFPPNHFNCRTTLRQLRTGVPTQGYSLPEIPEAFRNNVAATGKIFTDENTHIANTPKKVLSQSKKDFHIEKRLERYKEVEFYTEKIGKGFLEVFNKKTHKQNKNEQDKNYRALKIYAKNGGNLMMLPRINDNKSDPDGFNKTGYHFIDVKVPESRNGQSIIQNALKEASRQGAKEILLHLTIKPISYRDIYKGIMLTLNENRNKNVERITVIFPDESMKYYELDRKAKKIKKAQN